MLKIQKMGPKLSSHSRMVVSAHNTMWCKQRLALVSAFSCGDSSANHKQNILSCSVATIYSLPFVRKNMRKKSGTSSGGSKGAMDAPEDTNSFDFMQFLENFGKIVCWRLRRIGDPTWVKSWIRHWLGYLVSFCFVKERVKTYIHTGIKILFCNQISRNKALRNDNCVFSLVFGDSERHLKVAEFPKLALIHDILFNLPI